MGIATGDVFCGPLGSSHRRCFTVLGDVVNLAARLMQSSQGEIFCDEQTHGECPERIRFSRAPNHKIKSYDQPVAVFRANLPNSAAGQSENLIGRENELSILQEMLADSKAKAKTLVIEGEPGIGKSAVVRQLMRNAAQSGLVSILAEASNIDRFAPYYVFRPILTNILGLRGWESGSDRLEQALVSQLAFLPDDLRQLVPLLNSILATQLPENEFVEQLTGDRRTDNIQRLLTSILQRSIDNGDLHVLIFDDVQWMDEASWQLVRTLVDRLTGLTVILITRPHQEALSEHYVAIKSSDRTRNLPLRPLDRNGIQSLITQLVGNFELEEVVVDHIWTRSGGNPFFANELVKYLVESNQLLVVSGVCQLKQPEHGEEVAIPHSIRDVLAGRLDQLSPPVRLTAKTASVIGRKFPYQLLDAIYPASIRSADLHDYINDLCHHDIVSTFVNEAILSSDWYPKLFQGNSNDSGDKKVYQLSMGYTFTSLAIQQVAYKQLPVAQRRQFHGSVAKWYSEKANHDESRHAIVGQHFERSGQLPEAAKAFALAGEYALRQGATREAIDHFGRAIKHHSGRDQDLDIVADEIVPEPDLNQSPAAKAWEAHYRRLYGESLMQAGEVEASRIQLEATLRLLDNAPPQGVFWNALAMMRMILQQKFRRMRSRRPTKNILSDEPKIGAVEHCVALANQRLAQIHYFSNDLIIGTARALRALTVNESIDDSPGLARSYADLCIVKSLLRRVPAADKYAAIAEQVGRHVQHLPSLAYVLNVTNMHRLAHGRWSEVERLGRESVQIGEQLHCFRDRGESLTVLAMKHCFEGKLAKGRTFFDNVLDVAREGRNDLHCAWAHGGRGEALLRMGRYSEAETELRLALQILDGSVHHTEQIRDAGLLALCLWRSNMKQEALRYVNDVFLASENKTSTASALEGISGAAEVLFDSFRGRPMDTTTNRKARRILRQLRIYAKVFPIGKPRLLYFQGIYAALSGKIPAANRRWRAAIDASQEIGLSWEQAFVELEQAKWQMGAVRQGLLQSALAILEQTEFAPQLNLALGMLDE